MKSNDFHIQFLAAILVIGPYLLTAQSGWKVRHEGSQSRPVLQDGVLYVGSLDGSIYALDPATGHQLWAVPTGEGFSSGPEQVVIPASTDLATQVNMIANRPLRDRKKEIQGTPVISDGILWAGSEDFNFYAVNTADGTIKWIFETGGRVNTEPIVDDDQVYFVSEDGLLYVLDKSTGEKKLEVETYTGSRLALSQPGPFPNPPNQPVFGDGNIYLSHWVRGTVKKVYVSSISTESGERNWEIALEGWDVQDPILVGDKLLILYETNGSASEPSYMRVCALNPSTGDILWSYDQQKVYGFKNFSADSQAVYFESPAGFIVLDINNGALKWSYTFDEKKINLPERSYLVDDQIFLVNNGNLLVMNPEDGTIRKTLKTDRFFRIHHREGDTVIGTSEKQLKALSIASGKTIWSVKTNTALSSAPVFDDQMIYFTTGSFGYVGMSRVDQGYFNAVNRVTGK